VTGDAEGADVLLADGTTAHVRPITPGDAERLVAFHAGLSLETVVLRFFGAHPRLSAAEVERFTHVDGVDRVALVAERGGDLVAVARYDRPPGAEEAEVAFVVADEFQGRGLGTILLEHLASAARSHGIRRFTADTLSENFRMLHVFRDAGFARRFSRSAEVTRVVLDIAPSAAARATVDERDRRAVVRSMARLLHPASIVVVGDGRDPRSAGQRLLANLRAGGFPGSVYPVDPSLAEGRRLGTWSGFAEVPDGVDLAVVTVPAAEVAASVQACGQVGVRSLVVTSAGFAEAGEAGARRQDELVRLAHILGMRLVGPNCPGLINTDPACSVNATVDLPLPPAGGVGVASQSASLAAVIVGEASGRELGLSSVVTLGNKADVSGNDTLQWWEEDPSTDVVLLYLESFGNPRRFARIARRVGQRKPIVALTSGRSAPGRRGATSHTAARPAPEEAVDALFRRTGVLRVDTVEELLDVATVLSHEPLPRGPRVGIVGNAGGPGVLAADACVAHGLTVPELSTQLRARLGAVAAERAITNPVDLGDDASADEIAAATAILGTSGEVDAVVVAVAAPATGFGEALAAGLSAPGAPAEASDAWPRGGRQGGGKADGRARGQATTLVCLLGAGRPHHVLAGGRRPRPCFAYPETAVRALAKVAAYGAWRGASDDEEIDAPGVDPHAARRALESVEAEEVWVDGAPATALLAAYGIPEHPPRVRVAAGFVQDPDFGPMVRLGPVASGGAPARLVLGLAPLTVAAARELVLAAAVGAPDDRHGRGDALDDALVDMVVRLGRMAEDLPDVAELVCECVPTASGGDAMLAARFRPAPPPPVDDRRHLR